MVPEDKASVYTSFSSLPFVQLPARSLGGTGHQSVAPKPTDVSFSRSFPMAPFRTELPKSRLHSQVLHLQQAVGKEPQAYSPSECEMAQRGAGPSLSFKMSVLPVNLLSEFT